MLTESILTRFLRKMYICRKTSKFLFSIKFMLDIMLLRKC